MRMPLGIVALCFQRHGGPDSQSFPHLLPSSSVHLLVLPKGRCLLLAYAQKGLARAGYPCL
jgi:hypothetical protein